MSERRELEDMETVLGFLNWGRNLRVYVVGVGRGWVYDVKRRQVLRFG